MPKVVVTDSETGKSFDFNLTAEEVKIGRAAARNHIVLDDRQVSREHAVLRRLGSSYMIVDLNSANGTYFGNQRIKERVLSDSDSFKIGKYTFTFKKQEAPVSVNYGQQIGDTVLLRKSADVASSIPQISKAAILQTGLASQSVLNEIEALRKKAETLSRLYELNEMLGSVFSLEDIFNKVSDMMFRLTPADRFIVLLKDEGSDQLIPTTVKLRGQSGAAAQIIVSRTVVDRVLAERVSLLSLDTGVDERLASAKSIILHNIHSVMCAPLLGKNGPLGVIYVDCQQLVRQFTEDDLELLNAIAGGTSIAVDNAMTHKRLVKEELARAKYGRFMPKHVVDEILANPEALSLGGKNAIVTMLFSDIRGFTSMSETLPPETVVQILNEYFADMAPIVFKHDGLLDKYIGDGLMALFGVPYERDTAAADAVAAAIDMQRCMKEVNQELKSLGLSEISIGIGINTGMVTVGYIGSEERTDYTAIGDAVNLAARLEKEAQAGQIIISQATRDLVGDAFPVRAFGEVRVKGKREPVCIYEVLWRQQAQAT
jgi:adenylate cyclase